MRLITTSIQNDCDFLRHGRARRDVESCRSMARHRNRRIRVNIKSKRHSFITTSYILLECGNTAARRTYRQQPNLLRDYLEQRNEVIFPTVSDWDEAWKTYSTGDTCQAGIVDQVSFVVMRRLGIIEAFTNDKHFEAAGFRVLF